MMPAGPPLAVRPAPEAPQVAPFATVGVDNSSPEAFIRSVAPYAARVSKATGIPAEALIGMAANETGYGKYAAGNNLFGIKGTGPAGSFSTPTWEDYGNGAVTITDNFRAYHSPAESFIDFATLVTTSPRYKGAVGQTSVAGFVNGLRQGGYMTDPNYVDKISAITTRYQSVIKESLAVSGGGSTVGMQSASSPPPLVASAATPGRPAAGVVVPDQFHVGLPAEEAYAACGPVAAIAFAQVYGRNPTPTEAMTLAKQTGWTADGGMNGISNEKRLLDKLGLPSQLELGANWDHIRADALQHQPVILSTPGHYFVIDGYDAKTGAYHVGQSGKAYRGGSDWLTPQQIQGLAGAPSGALFTNHPLVSGQREVLPPDVNVLSAREVLPPLDLGNTPAPPTVAPPPPIPPPPPVGAVPPPTPAPPPVAAEPPPLTPTTASAADAGPFMPPGVAPEDVESPTLIGVPVEPAPSPQQQPSDTVRPGIPAGGAAIGAVAAAGHSQRQAEPPPPPPRRRPDDDLEPS